MDKREVRIAKEKILKCLTEDFSYGKTREGKALKRPKKNIAIFNRREGWAVFNATDLAMVMEKVVLGLYFAMGEKDT